MSDFERTENTIYPPLKDVMQRVATAVANLFRYDYDLLDVEANERSVTHKLAEHLQKEFPYWHVDCEYNRLGKEKKKLLEGIQGLGAEKSTSLDDTEGRTVFPDIIVHRRKTDFNLLIMEIKKDNNRNATMDIDKLKAFGNSEKYRYRFGAFLRLGRDGCSEIKFFKEGQEVKKEGYLLQDLIRKELEVLGYGE